MSGKDYILVGIAFTLLLAGAYYTLERPGDLKPVLLTVTGGMLMFLPWISLVGTVNRSGLGPLIFQRLGPKDILVLWISGAGKIYPVVATEAGYEKYAKIWPVGRIRITKNSTYTLPTGRKCVIGVAGCGYSIPVEQAEAARQLKELGFKDFKELEFFIDHYREFLIWYNQLTEEERRAIKEAGVQFVVERQKLEEVPAQVPVQLPPVEGAYIEGVQQDKGAREEVEE
jgi:hypothetical protein